MDILKVEVVWRGEAAGDVREAAEILRSIADKIEASIDSGKPFSKAREVTSQGVPVGWASIIRDKR